MLIDMSYIHSDLQLIVAALIIITEFCKEMDTWNPS